MGMPVWDDFGILNGATIGGGEDLFKTLTWPFNNAYFRPLISLSFFIDRQFFGTSPFFYHQTNIFIHLLTVGVVGVLGWKLFQNKWTALAGALLFGIQPVQVSTVAWIGGRTDSLCALFVTLFVLFLVMGVKATSRPWLWHIAGGIALLFAGLCKEQAIAALFVTPIAVWLLAPNDRRTFRDYYLTVAPYGFASFAFAYSWLALSVPAYESASRTWTEQIALGGRGILHNFGLLLAPSPTNLHTFTFENSRQLGAAPVILGYALLAASVIWLLRIRKEHPQVTLLGSLMLVTMLPVCHIIPLPSLLAAPYRVGISGVAVALILGWVVTKMLSRGIVWKIGATAILVWSLLLTTWAVPKWKDETTLFKEIVRHDPTFIIGRLNLNASHSVTPEEILENTEELLDWVFASHEWRENGVAMLAWESDPTISKRIRDNNGDKVYENKKVSAMFAGLAIANKDLGDTDAALRFYELSIEFHPTSTRAQIGLGKLHRELGNKVAAFNCFRIASLVAPKDFASRYNFAISLRDLGRNNEAIEQLEVTIQNVPWLSLSYFELADIWIDLERPDKVRETINRAVSANAVSRSIADKWLEENLRG